jgi:hypothetical protein
MASDEHLNGLKDSTIRAALLFAVIHLSTRHLLVLTRIERDWHPDLVDVSPTASIILVGAN